MGQLKIYSKQKGFKKPKMSVAQKSSANKKLFKKLK
jgi:hypothetical protein